MSDYTPSTEAVRARYSMQEPVQDMLGAEFDRWLQAHDRDVVAAERERVLAEVRAGIKALEPDSGPVFDMIYRGTALAVLDRMAVPAEQKASE
jgi:hypothetical protein